MKLMDNVSGRTVGSSRSTSCQSIRRISNGVPGADDRWDCWASVRSGVPNSPTCAERSDRRGNRVCRRALKCHRHGLAYKCQSLPRTARRKSWIITEPRKFRLLFDRSVARCKATRTCCWQTVQSKGSDRRGAKRVEEQFVEDRSARQENAGDRRQPRRGGAIEGRGRRRSCNEMSVVDHVKN